MPALLVAAALKSGCLIADRTFDRVYPSELRFVSYHHWTPVAVATRAANLLVEAGATRILDVGAGPGKFCLIGALTTNAIFTGIEQRPQLVQIARAVAFRVGTERARFFQGNALRFPFNRFDGFYLYNPFYEHLDPTLVRIDDTVTLSSFLFESSILRTRRKLARLPIGVPVVTYNGFGGIMPASYTRVRQETAAGVQLVLWIKTRA